MTTHSFPILIIEPHEGLDSPYAHVADHGSITRVASIEKALHTLTSLRPSCVMLSSSFSVSKVLPLLETLKHMSHTGLIPLIFVVDHSSPISTIPGTTWGSHCAVLSTLSNKEECYSTLRRILSS